MSEEWSLPQFLQWYRACPTSGFTGCRTEMWGDEATGTSHGAGDKARSEGYRLGTIWVSSCPRQLLLLLLVLTLTLQALHTQFFPPLSSLPFLLQLLFPSLKTQGLTQPIHAASSSSSFSGTKAESLHWWPHKLKCWLLLEQCETTLHNDLSLFCILAGVMHLLLPAAFFLSIHASSQTP